MPKDLFATVPEFLAAFDNILENGFFEDIQFNMTGKMMEGKIFSCSIMATGCVPNDSKYAKYKPVSSSAIIDPRVVVDSCRALAEEKRVKSVFTKVETQDWPRWSRDEERIIGSKGQRTNLNLTITFKT